MDLSIIVALTKDHVIGKGNQLPWHIPEDLKNFKRLTQGNVVVMGRKTWESIPEKFRPLPNRHNIVISSSLPPIKGVEVCSSLDDALTKAKGYGKRVFIIGGANVYQQTLPLVGTLYLSYVKKTIEGDAFFPSFNKEEWVEVGRAEFEEFTFVTLRRKDHESN